MPHVYTWEIGYSVRKVDCKTVYDWYCDKCKGIICCNQERPNINDYTLKVHQESCSGKVHPAEKRDYDWETYPSRYQYTGCGAIKPLDGFVK